MFPSTKRFLCTSARAFERISGARAPPAALVCRSAPVVPAVAATAACMQGHFQPRAFCTASNSDVHPVAFESKGIEYRQLGHEFDPELLFEFNKTHGSTPLNFIPDGPVRKHFEGLSDGSTVVWAAFDSSVESKRDGLVGFITAGRGGGYWLQTAGDGDESNGNKDNTWFINEFVVQPNHRGKRIGVNLTTLSVDPDHGIWNVDPASDEMYTTVHVGNVPSRTAFVKGGYHEVLTYADAMRDRDTTVLKCARPARS